MNIFNFIKEQEREKLSYYYYCHYYILYPFHWESFLWRKLVFDFNESTIPYWSNVTNRIIHIRALTGVGAGLLEWGVMSPSEAVYVCLLVFNQSGDGLASFSGAYRTRKSFGWPSLSSKSLCKSSLFFTFIFQSMGRYTWERGRYQFAMGKKNTDFVSEL